MDQSDLIHGRFDHRRTVTCYLKTIMREMYMTLTIHFIRYESTISLSCNDHIYCLSA